MYQSTKAFAEVNDDIIIWRYMDFASFCYLLVKKTLFFKRLDKHSDQLEGTILEETKSLMLKYRKAFQLTTELEAEKWVENFVSGVEQDKPNILSNSWIMSNNESYSMWKIYLHGSNEGIALKTTVGKLKKCFIDDNYKIYISKVSYETLDANNINQYSVGTNKSKPYIYENELRAIILTQFKMLDNKKTAKFEIGTDVFVGLEILLDVIHISPFSGNWFQTVVTDVVKKYVPTFNVANLINSTIKDQ